MAAQNTIEPTHEEMATAAATVFHTVELLEEILLALPTRDLLLIQRVCRVWKTAMKTSIRIQHALFLKPISVGSTTVLFNPLLPGLPGTAPWRYHPQLQENTEDSLSINKMLICQPAVPRIMIRVRVDLGSASLTHHSWVVKPQGVRMRDIHDKLERTVANSRPQSKVSFVIRPNGPWASSSLGLMEW